MDNTIIVKTKEGLLSMGNHRISTLFFNTVDEQGNLLGFITGDQIVELLKKAGYKIEPS